MTTSHKGSFFAIDRRIWLEVCDRGMNSAAAYLVMACGTGRDNRTTRWSAQALSRYAGITWVRGKEAIEQLIHDGFLRRAADHTPGRPRFDLIPFTGGDEVQNGSDAVIWLPNTFVTGTLKGERSPVQRLRSAGDILAMRLVVEMYHAQNLRDDGGISSQIIRGCYERQCIGERGVYLIWGFKFTQGLISWNGPLAAYESTRIVQGEHPIWRSIGLLKEMGLLTFIPHIFESDLPQSEVLHPYGFGASGEEPIEEEIGGAADTAAREMCPDWQIESAVNEGLEHFCPVPRTQPNVQMIGVARLRYRPHTSRTAAWYAQLQRSGSSWIEMYQDLAVKARAAGAAKAQNGGDRWLNRLG